MNMIDQSACVDASTPASLRYHTPAITHQLLTFLILDRLAEQTQK
jgi:hypothetical protein